EPGGAGLGEHVAVDDLGLGPGLAVRDHLAVEERPERLAEHVVLVGEVVALHWVTSGVGVAVVGWLGAMASPCAGRSGPIRCASQTPTRTVLRPNRAGQSNKLGSTVPGSADGGGTIPRCCHAAAVATRPRGVRMSRPCWIRYG